MDRERALQNAILSRRSGGVIRQMILCDVYGGRERGDLIAGDLNGNAGPNADDEFRLGVETSDGPIISGVVVDAAFKPEEGSAVLQGPGIAETWRGDEEEKGSIFYLSHVGAHFVFLFRSNITDRVLEERAVRGAKAIVQRFIERHRLGPQEYRRAMWSAGYEVAREQAAWRLCPRARIGGRPPYPSPILSAGVTYRAGDLARIVEEVESGR